MRAQTWQTEKPANSGVGANFSARGNALNLLVGAYA